jgi:hypothetical protein
MRRIKAGSAFALVDDDVYEREKVHRWKLDHNGYPYRTIPKVKRFFYLHHAVLGSPPANGLLVDHINGVRLDARRSNLRWADASQNQANRQRIRGKVPLKGVCIHKQTGKFQAQIKVRQRNHYLGLYDDEVAAAQAYSNAARRYFGEFAYASVPPSPESSDERRAA